MNLMTLQRYRNELILLASLLFALFAFLYKNSATTYVETNRLEIQKQIAEIGAINKYKTQWDGKKIPNKIKVLKSVVPSSKVKSFKKKSKKLVASYHNLSGNEVTKITNKLLNIPVQITNLQITESAKNQFTMELTCKW